MLKRIGLFLINIFFPPLTVLLLSGPEADFAVNCALFICGVLPSHIHCFYISQTYFHRKRKVRKGRYPGNWKTFIYSEKVQFGGASRQEYKELQWEKEHGKNGGGLSRSSTRKSKKQGSNQNSGYPGNGQPIDQSQMVQRQNTTPSGTYRPNLHLNTTVNQAPVPQRSPNGRSSVYASSVPPSPNQQQVRPQLGRTSSSSRNSTHSQMSMAEDPMINRRGTSRRNGAYPPNAYMTQSPGIVRSNSRGSSNRV